MGFSGYITITRPLNASVAGIASLLGYLIAAGGIAPGAALLIPVVILITAAGNVINDYCDRDIDRINRPDRPIPRGSVYPRSAFLYSILLFASGIGTAVFTSPLCLGIALANAAILILYAYRLKGMPFVGNLAVSYLAASIFLFGGALAGPDGMLQTVPVVAMTLCAMLCREMLKDAEDVEGDSEGGAVTLPMVVGVRMTSRYAFVAAVIGVAISYLPVMRWWGVPYLAAISVVNAGILAGALLAYRCTRPACVRESRATTVLKIGMFAALAVFIAAAVAY
ncbi:MAG: geranylgeranylglycerol-phosphate geranylgeranyltransferase [Methanomicrobiales archaeon]|nr:geranylgeranylglycerol-phosphate geranylgeranyltransferase [Methanomicrobiales archaeon]